jgi:transcriptional regulator with XRE-family HTH domain
MMNAAQCRAARGLLDWTQATLAEKAGVSLSTVRGFETGRHAPIGSNLSAIARAFESAGVEFTNGGAPGVRLSEK